MTRDKKIIRKNLANKITSQAYSIAANLEQNNNNNNNNNQINPVNNVHISQKVEDFLHLVTNTKIDR